MQTLSFGYLKPDTGDLGSAFFPACEFDIIRLNGHNHDGTNSTKLTSASIATVTFAIAALNWLPVVGQPGTFFQDVSMPLGLNYDNYFIAFKEQVAGFQLFPSVERLSPALFRVFINDASLSLFGLLTS